MGRGNGIALGRFRLRWSNWFPARWLPPSWGCAPSHLPPGGRYCGVPPLSMCAQCSCFRSPFRSVTIPKAKRLPCQRELAKISDFCLRDSTADTSHRHKPMWKGTHPIAPDRRELSPQVTEGACGLCSFGLQMGWYLLIAADTLCRFYR